MQQIIWDLPSDLLHKSVEHMRAYGARGHEGLGLWFGNERDGTVSISHLVVPYGTGLITHPLHLSLSMRAMSRLTYWAAQIHSHPGTMLELSDVDKEMGIRVQDYLSVVCPHYAQRNTREIGNCGVHVFDYGAYRRLTSLETMRRINISQRPIQIVPVEVLE
jgi:hypothetical protein